MLGEQSQSEKVSENATSTDHFDIWLPDRASVLRIRFSAIRDLRAAVDDDVENVGVNGVLLASISEESVCLEACEAVGVTNDTRSAPRGHIERALSELIAARQQDSPRGDLIPIGLFRTTALDPPVMNASDYRVARRCLRAPGSLFLIIQTSPHVTWTASLFTWRNRSATKSMTPIMSFVWDEDMLATEAADLNRRSLSSVTVPTGASLTPPAWLPRPEWLPAQASLLARSKVRIRNVVSAILLLIAAMGIASMVYRVLQPESRVAVLDLPNSNDLGLRVTRNGQDFEISWNQSSTMIQHASYGLLTIRDNQFTRVKDLSPDQLRAGRILYSPASKEPKFKLELKLDDQRTASDSVEVLQAGLGPESSPVLDPVLLARLEKPAHLGAPVATTQELIRQREVGTSALKTANLAVPGSGEKKKFSPPERSDKKPSDLIELPPPNIPRDHLKSDSKPLLEVGFAGALSPPPPPKVSELSPAMKTTGVSNTDTKPAVKPGPAIRSVDSAASEPVRELQQQSQKQSEIRSSRMAALTSDPQVVRRVQPQIPPTLRGLSSEQEIELVVGINEKGRVVHTKVARQMGLMAGLLVPSALEAARQWIFKPAQRGDEKVPSEYVIQFVFSSASSRRP